jgi:hypothetical protein
VLTRLIVVLLTLVATQYPTNIKWHDPVLDRLRADPSAGRLEENAVEKPLVGTIVTSTVLLALLLTGSSTRASPTTSKPRHPTPPANLRAMTSDRPRLPLTRARAASFIPSSLTPDGRHRSRPTSHPPSDRASRTGPPHVTCKTCDA